MAGSFWTLAGFAASSGSLWWLEGAVLAVGSPPTSSCFQGQHHLQMATQTTDPRAPAGTRTPITPPRVALDVRALMMLSLPRRAGTQTCSPPATSPHHLWLHIQTSLSDVCLLAPAWQSAPFPTPDPRPPALGLYPHPSPHPVTPTPRKCTWMRPSLPRVRAVTLAAFLCKSHSCSDAPRSLLCPGPSSHSGLSFHRAPDPHCLSEDSTVTWAAAGPRPEDVECPAEGRCSAILP